MYFVLHSRDDSPPIRRFALIGHPRSNIHLYKEIERRLLDRGDVTDARIEALADDLMPFITDFIEHYADGPNGIVSGMHIGVPVTESIICKKPRSALRQIEQALMLAARAGAHVAVLGGLTSSVYCKWRRPNPVGLRMAITSGSALTSAASVKMIERAARAQGITLARTTAAIVGASGDVGHRIGLLLHQLVSRLHLIARSSLGLVRVASELKAAGGGAEVALFTDLNAGIKDADIIVAVSSTSELPVDKDRVKPGALVCDVGYPRNIASELTEREDVFVFRGGLMKLPRPLKLSVDLGLDSSEVIYACFAEAMVIALSGAGTHNLDKTTAHPLAHIENIYELARDCGFTEACPCSISRNSAGQRSMRPLFRRMMVGQSDRQSGH